MTLALPDSSRLTPDEVRDTWFQPAKLGHRGLDEGQVRAFCAKVEHELTSLLEEKSWLEREVERLRTPGPVAGTEAERHTDLAHAQAVRILARAQQTADRYVAEAQDYSRQLAEDARRRRDEIVTEARNSAERVLDEAPASDAELEQMRAELAYLRTFSEVCRTHLRTYLEALTRNVDEWERKDKQGI
jgi:DivIVA domain-containing protein